MKANTAILPEVSCKIRAAQACLQLACSLLRENGYPDSAVDLSRLGGMADVWVKPEGLLHWLAQPDSGAGGGK